MYSLSARELERVSLGLGLRWIAFREMNTYYSSRAAKDGALSFRNPDYAVHKAMIGIQDVLARLRLVRAGILCAVVFKSEPSTPLRASLSRFEFRISELPHNPHTSRNGPIRR